MNGVEILSEHIVNTTKTWVATVGVLSVIATVMFTLILVKSNTPITFWIGLVGAILCAIPFFTLAIIDCSTDCLKEYDHTEYKVVVDETVSMVEFMDKYEIIYQEGKIYTVRERE